MSKKAIVGSTLRTLVQRAENRERTLVIGDLSSITEHGWCSRSGLWVGIGILIPPRTRAIARRALASVT